MDNSSEKSSYYDGHDIEHGGKITFKNNTDLMNNTQEQFNDSSSDGGRRGGNTKL
jgi:hypothetical protein